MDDRWLSMKEICEYLGVSHDTISCWIAKDMPALKMGGIGVLSESKLISGLRKVAPKKVQKSYKINHTQVARHPLDCWMFQEDLL